MSDVASNWAVVWVVSHAPAAGEARTFHRSREMALGAACNAPRQYQTALRIEGPNGVVIEREAIEQYCQDRPRRP